MSTMEKGRIAPITLTTLNGLAPAPDRYMVWDDKLKGFGVRVSPSGIKAYIVRYRVGGGRRGTLRQMTLGASTTLTPDQARKAAKSALALVETGQDPQGHKAAQRAELTVSELCDRYMEEGVETKKASTLYVDRGRIDHHIKPLIGSRKVSEVTTARVEDMMRAIGNGKLGAGATSRAKGGKPAAGRTVALLSSIFTFAISRGLCRDNPCRGVKQYKAVKHERFLDMPELTKLGETLAELDGEGWSTTPLTILRMLTLTGCRKSEIVKLKWSEVDGQRSILRLIDSKTGPKAVQVGAPVLQLLAEVDRGPSPYVFPDPRDPQKPYHALDHDWGRIRKRAGLEGLRIHDLRHSYASVGLAGGAGLPIIGKLLGHSNVQTTSRYAHLADNPLRAAADSIANTIAGALDGKSAEVLVFNGRKADVR